MKNVSRVISLVTIVVFVLYISGCGGGDSNSNEGNGGPLEKVQLTISDTTSYSLMEVKLDAVVSGGDGPLDFTWEVNSTEVENNDSTYYFSRYVKQKKTYSIMVSVTDGINVVASTVVNVKVRPHPDGAILYIANGSGKTIDQLYVYPIFAKSMGPNLLGNSTMPNDTEIAPPLTGLTQTSYFVAVRVKGETNITIITNGGSGFVANSVNPPKCLIYNV